MNPFELKKDTHAGKPVMRLFHDNGKQTIFHPPQVLHGEAPAVPLEELLEGAMAAMFQVADHADPHVKLQAMQTQEKLRRALRFWMHRAEIATAARLRDKLRSLGFAEAAEAIKHG